MSISGVLGPRECKEAGDLDMQESLSTNLRKICWIRSSYFILYFLRWAIIQGQEPT